MTEVDDRNFTPEGTSNKRWKELEAAEKKQEQSRQNSDGSGNDEQKFTPYFADANRQIDELESEANGKKSQIDSDLLKSKIEIVKDLAQKIEKAGFPVKGIANEIVHQLNGRISPTHIRENLEEKYKDRRQSKNAKKRKVATVVLPTDQHSQPTKIQTEVDELSQKHPEQSKTELEKEPQQKQQITVGVGGHEITDTGDLSMHSLSEQDIATIESSEDSDAKESPQPQQQQQQPQQVHAYDLKILINWEELSEKMAELHYKDIKNFWLCGRIENSKLLDIVLERSQPSDREMEVVA